MSEPVAIVHDWLTSMRGGERVAEVLCSMFPQAELFTLTRDLSRLSPVLVHRKTTTSLIDRVASAPLVRGRFRALLPLFPLAVESFRLDRYSLIISSSHCVALGAIAPPTAFHVAYVHSTLRYAREAQRTYEASVPGGPVGRALFRGSAHYLRHWENKAAARPHLLIANSTYTRARIRDYYRRDALVIAPPIDTSRFERAAVVSPRPNADAPFLMVSALVPNKRVDLALRSFQGRPERLVVVGEGRERARLDRLVSPNVTLLSGVNDEELTALYTNCKALLHTGIDDFGMVMVEALAAGKPVLASAEGGALDIVRDGENGLLIAAPTVEAVRAALDRFARRIEGFDPDLLKRYARRFDRAQFERRFSDAIEEARHQRRNGKPNGVHSHHGGRLVELAGYGSTDSLQSDANGSAAREMHTKVQHEPNDPPFARDALAVNHSRLGVAAKRAADVVLAASGLVVTAPLVASLAALIPLDSPGPAFFFQRRPGLHQRPFTLVKLRTMDSRGRVTRLGRVLRPLGLDELPQLWNVLKGDMSLIGPRPEVLERAKRYEFELPGYETRHLMRPGITGWAQVNGLRGNVSIAKRLEFDMQYLREWNLGLDGRILLRTVSTVLGDTLRDLRG